MWKLRVFINFSCLIIELIVDLDANHKGIYKIVQGKTDVYASIKGNLGKEQQYSFFVMIKLNRQQCALHEKRSKGIDIDEDDDGRNIYHTQ